MSAAESTTMGHREYLRQATGSLHQKLDQHPSLLPLAASEDRAVLVGSLRALSAALRPVEQRLLERSDLAPPEVGWLSPSLSERFAADLARADVPVPVTLRLPESAGPSNAAEWMGAAWVLAGSRHGAASLARRLESVMGFELESFAKWSPPDRVFWKTLVEALDRVDSGGPNRHEGVLAGSTWAFETIFAGLPPA